MWIEIKEGCELPERDRWITIRYVWGYYQTLLTDKDNEPLTDKTLWYSKAHPFTHWQYVIGPDEEPKKQVK